MKLSRSEEIALLLTSELVHSGDAYMSLTEIAQRHGISPLFLKNIARLLKKDGLILSKEGQNGGYALGKPPSEISALDVIESVSGKSQNFGVLKSTFTCPLHPACMPQKIRQLISEAFTRYLSDISIDQFSKGGSTS